MRKELNILVIFFVLAVTPLAIYFSQQPQTTQQQASEPTPTYPMPTFAPTETPTPTPTTSIAPSSITPKVTTIPTR